MGCCGEDYERALVLFVLALRQQLGLKLWKRFIRFNKSFLFKFKTTPDKYSSRRKRHNRQLSSLNEQEEQCARFHKPSSLPASDFQQLLSSKTKSKGKPIFPHIFSFSFPPIKHTLDYQIPDLLFTIMFEMLAVYTKAGFSETAERADFLERPCVNQSELTPWCQGNTLIFTQLPFCKMQQTIKGKLVHKSRNVMQLIPNQLFRLVVAKMGPFIVQKCRYIRENPYQFGCDFYI